MLNQILNTTLFAQTETTVSGAGQVLTENVGRVRVALEEIFSQFIGMRAKKQATSVQSDVKVRSVERPSCGLRD